MIIRSASTLTLAGSLALALSSGAWAQAVGGGNDLPSDAKTSPSTGGTANTPGNSGTGTGRSMDRGGSMQRGAAGGGASGGSMESGGSSTGSSSGSMGR